MNLPLLHRRISATGQPCWMCRHTAGQPFDGVTTLCPDHTAQIRQAATAQAQPGYGVPHACPVCTESRIDGQPHGVLGDPRRPPARPPRGRVMAGYTVLSVLGFAAALVTVYLRVRYGKDDQ